MTCGERGAFAYRREVYAARSGERAVVGLNRRDGLHEMVLALFFYVRFSGDKLHNLPVDIKFIINQ